jgi:CheY-like chemotaxis protein
VTTRAQILLVDDEANIRRMLAALLREEGFTVAEAPNGNAALLGLDEVDPDVVLLDLLMPGQDGWKTAAALREHPDTANIPIVAVTVLPPEEALRDGDLDGYVEKPLDEDKLAEALDRALLRAAGDQRVLVVEDDPDLGQILCATLERFGVGCEHARDGNAAIEAAGRLRPQLILLDLGLPGPDGFAVVDALRDDEATGGRALIVYTARELGNADKERLRLGDRTEFLAKGEVAPGDVGRRVVEVIARMTTQTNGKGT